MCLLKDKPCKWKEEAIDPDTGREYPFGDKGITCPYLRKAVLPGSKNLAALYEAYLNDYDGRQSIETITDNCERCKTPIVKASNRQKYCSSCRKKEDRIKMAALMRKRRAEGRA